MKASHRSDIDDLYLHVHRLENSLQELNIRHRASNTEMMELILQMREDIRQQAVTNQGYSMMPHESFKAKENQAIPMEITEMECFSQYEQGNTLYIGDRKFKER